MYAKPQDVEEQGEQWRFSELATLTALSHPETALLCLGVSLGGPSNKVKHFETKSDINQAMHEKSRACKHSQTEIVLTASCASINKVTHLLRICGLDLFQDGKCLRRFDSGTHKGSGTQPPPEQRGTLPDGARDCVQHGIESNRLSHDCAATRIESWHP